MDPSSVKKNSAQVMAMMAVTFSCTGGMQIGLCIHQLIASRSQYNWIGTLLIGSAFICYGIFWAVMLVRRATLVGG